MAVEAKTEASQLSSSTEEKVAEKVAELEKRFPVGKGDLALGLELDNRGVRGKDRVSRLRKLAEHMLGVRH